MSYEVKFDIDQNQENLVSRKLIIGGSGAGVGAGQSEGTNVKIHVTNLDSLDEFEGTSVVNTDYLPKLQSWINKKKYTCTENYSDNSMHEDTADDNLQLQVDIFNFQVKKIEKTDMEKIKEEMEALKQERLMIDREMKLFNFHFFSMATRNENKNGVLGNLNGLNQQLGGLGFNHGGLGSHNGTIFSVDQLYYTLICQGVVEVANSGAAPPQGNDQMMGGGETSQIMDGSGFSDDLSRSHTGSHQNTGASHKEHGHSSGHRSVYLIELKEPLPQDAMTLSLNNQSGQSSKNFEILLYGQGCKNHIVAKMAKNHVRKTVHVDVTLYYYPINVSVKNSQQYTVYIPKQI